MLFFKRYRTIITAFILVLIPVIIIFYSLKYPSASVVRNLVMEISGSVEFGITGLVDGVRNVWNRYIFLVELEDENRRLKEQNAQLLGELIKYREGYLEAKRLQNILELKRNTRYPVIGAQVINIAQASLFKTLMINRGKAHGLKVDMPVIASKGIVGRITEISWHTARVLLVIDVNSNIDALIQRTRTQGILQGSGFKGGTLKYVLKSADVSLGDVVISSGMGGLFPKEILLGTVKKIDKDRSGLFQYVEVSPSVDFNKLEEVLVLVGGDKK
ncbi:MAG: rod shape-determining protein MreC [Deltaproteobacteria bacterium]|nr:rod shape-determining protein MreC [Deltaproteobacteria bacterium]